MLQSILKYTFRGQVFLYSPLPLRISVELTNEDQFLQTVLKSAQKGALATADFTALSVLGVCLSFSVWR